MEDYLRNLAMYLIFDAFIGIILPSDKYKKYISLVSGFILILIMLTPINNLFSNSFHKLNMMEVRNNAIKKQIESIAQNVGFDISHIQIFEDTNKITQLKIKVRDEVSEKQAENFRKTLGLLYDIDMQKIEFN